jgi:hypothetical protein
MHASHPLLANEVLSLQLHENKFVSKGPSYKGVIRQADVPAASAYQLCVGTRSKETICKLTLNMEV